MIDVPWTGSPSEHEGRMRIEPPADTETLDDRYHVLQNQRRRLVLEYLLDSGQSDIGTLSDHVAAAENDLTPDAVSSDQRKRVYISLYQSHLPTLEECGVVEYDGESVVPTDELAQYEAYLRPAESGADTTTTDSGGRATLLGGVVVTGLALVSTAFLTAESRTGLLLTGLLAVAVVASTTYAIVELE